jgi:hypothetical protein
MSSDNEIKTILNEPGTSYWLKNALASALDRDPVNAVNDAKLLAMVLGHRVEQIAAKPERKNILEKKEKSALDLFMDQLIKIKAEDISLKFIFDNIKNYVTAGTVFFVGFYLLRDRIIHAYKYYSEERLFDSLLLIANIFPGLFFVMVGIVLHMLNYFQTTWALKDMKISNKYHYILMVFLYFSTIIFGYEISKKI